jgi:hypothetical protein
MLLSDVSVNLRVISPGIFFLPLAKWYVVSDTPHSGISARILFSHLHRHTHWSNPNTARPIKLDMPGADVLFGFLHGISWIPSWIGSDAIPGKQDDGEDAQDFHITRDEITCAHRKPAFCAPSLHIQDDFPASVAFFEIRKSILHVTQGLVSPVDHGRNFS